MWYVRTIRTIPMVCFGMLLAAVSLSRAESVYRWTDAAGVSCYSNVAPPASVLDYSVAYVSRHEEKRPARHVVSTDTDASEAPDPIPADMLRASLQKRILHREASIRQIEVLLKKHPDDMLLRKQLFRKRRYLHEEQNRLNSLN